MTPIAPFRRAHLVAGLDHGARPRGSAAVGQGLQRWFAGCLLAGFCLCLLGCGRHGASAAGGSADAATAATLAELTQVVRQYGAEQRQVPSSLDDLVARGYLKTVPAAPKGKRFAINKRLEVFLVEAKP
ncbi:MAG: hypothetical protein KGS61_11190 [Verrucomicrobia bacterium]|nr:hypothetical protein [Verrucomicrobiota bacterium]